VFEAFLRQVHGVAVGENIQAKSVANLT